MHRNLLSLNPPPSGEMVKLEIIFIQCWPNYETRRHYDQLNAEGGQGDDHNAHLALVTLHF